MMMKNGVVLIDEYNKYTNVKKNYHLHPVSVAQAYRIYSPIIFGDVAINLDHHCPHRLG